MFANWGRSRLPTCLPFKLQLRSLATPRGLQRAIASERISSIANASGWSLERRERFAIFDVEAFVLKHEDTGATFVHLDSSNTDNVFMVSFVTPPRDSSGVAHILEHLSLCGSADFPVRDPFFRMTRRSLSTFMNAMTASDHTMYPFSTQNDKDYENLMKVYLDAVFFPCLRKLDFLQEGHRISPHLEGFKRQGVVFNEMKGAMSDASSIFYHEMQSTLFPSTTYHFNSGGDPRHIPDLTYENLVNFYKETYHPSNACFYSYGDLSPPLEYLSKNVLCKFQKQAKISIPDEEGLREHQHRIVSCPENALASNPDKQAMFGLSFLCDDFARNPEETVALKMLSLLLLDGPSSPMYQKLILSGLGSSFSPGSGFSTNTKQASFSFGLAEIDHRQMDHIHEVIMNTLHASARSGFDQQRLDAIVHQVELSAKEINSRFGLGLGFEIAKHWMYDGDVFCPLKTTEYVNAIDKRIKSGERVMENLIESKILRNMKSASLLMMPDKAYLQKLAADEEKRIQDEVNSLSEEELQSVNKDSRELEDFQKLCDKEDSSVLPSLTVMDIPKEGNDDNFNFIIAELNGTSIQQNHQPTNGLVYLRCAIDTKVLGLTVEEMVFLPLFASFVTELGAGDKNYEELSQELELYTAGISCSLSFQATHSDVLALDQQLIFSGSCLERNCQKLVDLLDMVLSSPRFDENARIEALLLQFAAGLSESLQDSGHSFAMTFANYLLGTPVSISKEKYAGASFVKSVSDLADPSSLQQNLKVLRRNFVSIAKKIAQNGIYKLAVNADLSGMNLMMKELESRMFLQERYRRKNADDFIHDSAPDRIDPVYLSLPIQVRHIAMSIPTVAYTNPDHAKLRVLSGLLSSVYLHREIREIGGAYGSGAMQSFDGMFTFYSYRFVSSSDSFLSI